MIYILEKESITDFKCFAFNHYLKNSYAWEVVFFTANDFDTL